MSNFKFYVPLDIQKGDDGEWRVSGRASTEDRDLQGEIVRQGNLDISPLQEGKGLFNWDHKDGPENIVGVIDKAEQKDDGLHVGGYLLKNTVKAKAVYDILNSLKKTDKKRLQMSVEGKILKRGGTGDKEIQAARIDKVALTFDAVNPNTYAELVKSLSATPAEEVIEKADKPDCLEMDVPLFIRFMEWAREDAKDDAELHVVAEKAVAKGSKLTMADYEALVPEKAEKSFSRDEVLALVQDRIAKIRGE